MSHRQTLRELAYETHGVVTLRDAEDAGVPAVEVRKLASRGALKRLGKGVYRMTEAPSGPLDEFAAAVALAGEDAVLADESVLAALDLTHVNLRAIRVATDQRRRTTLPKTVEVVFRHVAAHDRDDVDGIPAMSVAAAILGSRGRVMDERLADAASQARRRGLIGERDETALRQTLGYGESK